MCGRDYDNFNLFSVLFFDLIWSLLYLKILKLLCTCSLTILEIICGPTHTTHQKKEMTMHTSIIVLKVKYSLCFGFTVVQSNNYLKSTSAIKVTTMKIRQLREAITWYHKITKSMLFTVSKDNGTQRKVMKKASHVL